MKKLFPLLALSLVACGSEHVAQSPGDNILVPEEGETPAAPTGQAPAVRADGSRLFGAEPDPSRAVTPLASVMAAPQQFAGQVVKTEGTISAVCQRMGCWMELRATEDGPAITVPMAGHSFFLPRDVSGKHATVEGRVRVETMDEATQDHLREEGASGAVAQPFQIDATTVIVASN